MRGISAAGSLPTMASSLFSTGNVVRPRIYSIGHSSLPVEDFIRMLLAHEITRLADVRRFPVSRRHPQFSRDALAAALRERDIEYVHLGAELGGYTKSPYEEHVRTDVFRDGLEKLENLARREATVFMCAEKLPWRCHRRFIAQELLRRGWQVVHILDPDTVWDPEQPLLTMP